MEVQRALSGAHRQVRADRCHTVRDHAGATDVLSLPEAAFPGMSAAEVLLQAGPATRLAARRGLSARRAEAAALHAPITSTLGPRAAEADRPALRQAMEAVLSGIEGAAEIDAMADLARPYAARATALMLRLPAEPAARLVAWSERFTDPQAAVDDPELGGFASQLVAWRREVRDRDPLSALIAAQERGVAIGEEALRNSLLGIILLALHGISYELAAAAGLFAENPDQWARLRRSPHLLERAAEEVLRCAPLSRFLPRLVLDEYEHRGVRFAPGDLVLVDVAGAQEAGSARFDIAAARPAHLTFGRGRWHCCGSGFARVALQEALAALCDSVTGLDLAGELTMRHAIGANFIDALPLRPAWAGAGRRPLRG
jgi:cytochrome P450